MLLLPINSWAAFKSMMSSKALGFQYVEYATWYDLYIIEGTTVWSSSLLKDEGADVTDFENNYKSLGNKPSIPLNLPFGSKLLPDGKKLFRRVRGTSASVTAGSNNIDFIVPFTNCKITGLQILNAAMGDKASFQILDTDSGTISTVPYYLLNTFGTDVYIAPEFAAYPSKYDADLIAGLTLRIVYTATDSRTIYVNYDLHEVVTP